jgi:hypothetical protein
VVLDAPLPPADKLRLAPDLVGSVSAQKPRDALEAAIARNRSGFSGDELAAYDELGRRADDVLVNAVARAFKPAFLIAGGLALLGALALLAGLRLRSWLAVAAAAAASVPAGYAIARHAVGRKPVVLADPCQERRLPRSGGITGLLQDEALRKLDELACERGSSREELVLALVDPSEAERYQREYGVNPRTLAGAFDLLFR